MDNDIIQFGIFSFSKTILDVIAPLIGTLIGGLITFITTRCIETAKWEKEKKNKLQEQRREALGIALEWLDSFEIAISKISSLFSALRMNFVTQEEFNKKYPDLLLMLSKKDPPRRLQALLPENVYKQSNQLIHNIRDLNYEINREDFTKIKSSEMYLQKISEISEQIQSFSSYLNTEYLKTFD